MALVPARPLWLDEVLQLQTATDPTWSGFLQGIIEAPGGAPFGYLGPRLLVTTFGWNVFTARATSIAAAGVALMLLIALGRRLHLNATALEIAAGMWIVCPLALRYALEGRPYMQAICFTLAAAIAQIELSGRPTALWTLALIAALTGAVYSQPFALFAAFGFSLLSVWRAKQLRIAMLTAAAYAIAAAAFIPWMLMAQAYWRTTISGIPGGFHLSPSLLLLIVRELVGDGYPASLAAIALIAFNRRSERSRLAAAVIAAVLLAFAADAAFNYFFAMRQVLYLTPFLLLLAAGGSDRAKLAGCALAVFAIACVAKDYRYFTDRREDWARFSQRLDSAAAGGCILLPTGDNASLYVFFRPEIAQKRCGQIASAPRVVIPVNTYSKPEGIVDAERRAAEAGLHRSVTENAGFGELRLYGR